MSDGYETEELTRIEAALDALVSPTSEDVFQATRPFDERAIASVAATRGGSGGGGSSLTLLGPYTVTYADLDPVSAVFLVALDPGTIIVRPMIFITTLFTTAFEAVSVKVSDISEVHQATSASRPSSTPDENFVWGTLEQPLVNTADLGAIVGPDGAHLLAADTVGGNAAGVAVIYCLVKLP